MNKAKTQHSFTISNAPRDAQRRVCLTWLGLHLAGYELWQPTAELASLAFQLRQFEGLSNIRAYFARARNDSNTINPWWPGASALSLAAYFCDSDLTHIDLDGYRYSEEGSMAHMAWKDPAFLAWLSDLPQQLSVLRKPPLLAIMHAVDIQNDLKMQEHAEALQQEAALIAEFLGDLQTPVSLEFLANPLQAWQLTDYLRKPGKLTIIATHPRQGSFLHEFLHVCLEDQRDLLQEIINTRDLKKIFEPVLLTSLEEQGYAAVSEIRLLEEALVRSFTALLLRQDRVKEQSSKHPICHGYFLPDAYQLFEPLELTLKTLPLILKHLL